MTPDPAVISKVSGLGVVPITLVRTPPSLRPVEDTLISFVLLTTSISITSNSPAVLNAIVISSAIASMSVVRAKIPLLS